jgi:hypothetical protein
MQNMFKTLFLVSLLTGCASSPPSAPGPGAASAGCKPPNGAGCGPSSMASGAHAPMTMGPMMDMHGKCPMEVLGTTVRVADLPGAVAIDFVTSGDVAEVRRRAARMAEMHNQHAASGPGMMHGAMMMGGAGGPGMMHGAMMMGGAGGPGMMHGAMMMAGMPPSEARMEELPDGARLVLTPKDPKDLDALRQHANMHAMHAGPGSCPMLSAHAGEPHAQGASTAH